MSLVAVPVGVDHRDFQPVDDADGVDPDFAVVEAVVHPFDGRPLENPPGVLEGDFVPFDVGPVLRGIPGVAHRLYLHNVMTKRKHSGRAPRCCRHHRPAGRDGSQ